MKSRNWCLEITFLLLILTFINSVDCQANDTNAVPQVPGLPSNATLPPATLPPGTSPDLQQFYTLLQAIFQAIATLLAFIVQVAISSQQGQSSPGISVGNGNQLPPITGFVTVLPGNVPAAQGRSLEDGSLSGITNFKEDIESLLYPQNPICDKILLCLIDSFINTVVYSNQNDPEIRKMVDYVSDLFKYLMSMAKKLDRNPDDVGPHCNTSISECPVTDSLQYVKV